MFAPTPLPDRTGEYYPGLDGLDFGTGSAPAEGPGARVGPYKLLQQLGEGGMGSVFLAEQTRPVRRRVALKVIRPGMDTRRVVARFEAEQQALALMDHPNIAKVLDAGTTPAGRPFFVMELVDGVPITRFCDEHRLSVRERLELFVPVCQAIQHAHQKGTIHRDVKPSNILVTMCDGKPVPKVIDFGVAKATEPPLGDQTTFTQHGSFLGTPEYMAPEQAEMSAAGVDTRSDVYSLGVLLYELLTGTTPLDRKALAEAGFSEMVRAIREFEPPPPSARLSKLDTLGSVAAARQTDPGRLPRLVRGELDWIVLKALEKDRSRRYETANGLARDVQRYLADEPVEACPPSRGYRVRRFVRKYKLGVGVAAGYALVFVVAAVANGCQAVRANAERDRAVASEQALRRTLTRQMADRIEGDLLRLSTVGGALAATVEQGDDWDEPRLEAWMRRVLANEPQIFGLSVAFEPDTFDPRPADHPRRRPFAGLVPFGAEAVDPGRDGYSLYLHRDRPAGAVVAEPVEPIYRYRRRDWYADALTGRRVGWTEPYLDLYGGDVPMVSYVVPLRRRGDRRDVGVLSVDLSLEYFQRLAAWLEERYFGDGCYGFVLTAEGRVITHPHLSFEQVNRRDGEESARIQDVWASDDAFRELIEGKVLAQAGDAVGRAIAVDPATGRPSRFLYARVKPAGWALVAVVPDDTR